MKVAIERDESLTYFLVPLDDKFAVRADLPEEWVKEFEETDRKYWQMVNVLEEKYYEKRTDLR